MGDSNGQQQTVASAMMGRVGDARLRVLVVGAGIGGATLGALLAQRGEPPVLIERASAEGEGGYMLGMMPLGARVLNGLNLSERYLEASMPMRRYEFYDRHGSLLRQYNLEPIVKEFGAYQGIERGRLLHLLRGACGQDRIFYRTTLVSMNNEPDGVTVTFDDGSEQQFDLVVAADGIHSDTRRRTLSDGQWKDWHTGWGGWVVWSDLLPEDRDIYREIWAARWGIGLYPTRDRIGLFLGGQLQSMQGLTARDFLEKHHECLPLGPFRQAVDRVEIVTEPFFWKMEDGRSNVWWHNRVVLLGDAAAAFLPTAGVGASMAMDSAAALADELSRADVDHMPHALSLYERRQRPRVERTQTNSRRLARLMFLNTTPVAWARDQAMRFYIDQNAAARHSEHHGRQLKTQASFDGKSGRRWPQSILISDNFWAIKTAVILHVLTYLRSQAYLRKQ